MIFISRLLKCTPITRLGICAATDYKNECKWGALILLNSNVLQCHLRCSKPSYKWSNSNFSWFTTTSAPIETNSNAVGSGESRTITSGLLLLSTLPLPVFDTHSDFQNILNYFMIILDMQWQAVKSLLYKDGTA